MKAEIAAEDSRLVCLGPQASRPVGSRQAGNLLAGTIWKIILQ